jgi:hypothetical protein
LYPWKKGEKKKICVEKSDIAGFKNIFFLLKMPIKLIDQAG